MPDQTDIDDPAWMVVCQTCNKPFRRRSLRGATPKYCEDCKLAKKRADINKLRADMGQKPHEPKPEMAVVAKVEPSWLDDSEAQELLVERQRREQGLDEERDQFVSRDHADRPWPEHVTHTIDVGPVTVGEPDPELDAMIAESDEAGGYTASEDEIKELEEALAKARAARAEPTQTETPTKADVCIVGSCQTPDPRHVDRFCTSHWNHVSLEVRGVLLGAPRDSAPFDQAVGRALRQLRE